VYEIIIKIANMGQLEKELVKELRGKKIQKAILLSVAAAGLLSVAAMAPNALQMLAMFDRRLIKAGRRYNLNRSLDRLLYNELVHFEENKDGKFLRLTPRGEKEVTKYKLLEAVLNKPRKWDKKWRVLIFDIKEMKRGIRDNLRRTLKAVGFHKLQQSVWVYPYDCEDFMTLLKLDLKIGKSMLYMIVDKLENDGSLKDIFGINS